MFQKKIGCISRSPQFRRTRTPGLSPKKRLSMVKDNSKRQITMFRMKKADSDSSFNSLDPKPGKPFVLKETGRFPVDVAVEKSNDRLRKVVHMKKLEHQEQQHMQAIL